MQIHKKITIINTFLIFIFVVLFIYFFNIEISLNNLLKFLLFIFLFFIMSNFFTKFFLVNTYKTIQKLDKVLSLLHNQFIAELENNFLSLQECFSEVFSTVKLDILDILVKEEEIKKEKEKAEILSAELKELNKSLEDKVNERTRELSISKEIAESANKAKNEFLAKISHEMRTPLTPIIGYSRILAKEINDPSSKEKLEIIHTSGVKLLNFTNELLDFSKIESGKVDLNYETFNIRTLFQDIYHEHIDLAKSKNINFKIDYLHANVSIYSDKIKIYEIAKNIIHNALKYTEKGFVLCDVFVENNTLFFNVYDSGIGISEENIKNIFESFVQIGSEQSGAGLGLSITKKLLEVLNGKIEVESKVGIGSTFKIQIPIETSQKEFENFSDVINKILNSNNIGIKTIFLKSILKLPLRIKDLKEAHKKQDIEEVRKINHLIKGTYGNLNLSLVYDISQKISVELKKENISFDSVLHYIEELEYLTHTLDYNELFNTYLQFKERKIKILIAEDAEETRDFLKVLLETQLVEVICVENGLEALNLLKSEKFDLIFLDISMPVMDGVQTVTTIKANDNFKDIPVVALTAHAIIGYKEKYLNYGFDAYITKPINDSVLFSCLEKFVLNEKRWYSMIKLLIIEDSEETVDLIRLILSNESDIKIFDANSIKDSINLIKKDIFDIILLDLSLPDGNGTYVCEQVRKFPELYGKPFIIALTADTSQESVNRNLELGCDDYIKKPFDTEELLIRLKKFIKRLPQNKEVIIYENIKLFLSNKTVIYNDEFIDLSKNEFELLYYFIINKGLLLTRMNILDNVWKENLDISDKAVDQCLKRLRKKLPILNDNLISKRGFGYILK